MKKQKDNNLITSCITDNKRSACKVIENILAELSKPERIEEASVNQLTSVMATLIDKFGADEKDGTSEGILDALFKEFEDIV